MPERPPGRLAGLMDRDEVSGRAWRFRVFAGIFLLYVGYALADLPQETTGQQVLAVTLLLVFVSLYLGPLPLVMARGARPRELWVAASMAAVMVAYLVLVGRGGLVFTTYVAVALIVSLPRRVSLCLVVALAAAVTLLPASVPGWDVTGQQWALGGPILLVSLAMHALLAGSASRDALLLSRQQVRELATEQERLRIARDLHDLLGHALTAVTVKAELAARLVDRDPDRSRSEMLEVAELSRRGLADVRAAVAGYREVSLVGELASAREVLRAAGIAAELPAAVEDVPVELRGLFGWAVREGVTNAVRHSGAQHLRVTLGERSVDIQDDGPGAGAGVGTGAPGSGLAGLTERAAAAGGRVSAGPSPHGFRLRVEVPADTRSVPA